MVDLKFLLSLPRPDTHRDLVGCFRAKQRTGVGLRHFQKFRIEPLAGAGLSLLRHNAFVFFKRDVIAYDYVDEAVPVLKRMSEKQLGGSWLFDWQRHEPMNLRKTLLGDR